MLQVVYVLICNDENFFYEQFLISITSLKFQMKNVSIIVLTDQDTNNYLMNKHPEIKNQINYFVSYNMPKQYNMAARSRILKTKMRELIQGDFLFIDCDTLICESLDEICEIPYSSAVLDNHGTVENHIQNFRSVIKRANQFRFSVGFENCHYNTGVLWCKDNIETRRFFDNWYRLWKETYQKGVIVDQLSFNEINNRMNGVFRAMDGKWNCQIRCGIPFLAEAKIIHYFASNKSKVVERKFSYYFTDENIYKDIREKQSISEHIQEFIERPRSAFQKADLVEICTPNYYIINSNIGALFRMICRKFPKLFWCIDSILGVFRVRK